jgi:polyhydroxyalkanoate synthesis regulator phasin
MKKRFFGILLMGAMVVASMSMFTSCKDYDDDINKNADDISALRTELATLRSQMAPDLTAALAALDTKVNTKIDASALNGYLTQDALNGYVKEGTLGNYVTQADLAAALAGLSVQQIEEIAEAAATVAALETQIAAIDEAVGDNNIEEMAATIAALTGKMDALEAALAAVNPGISEADAEAIAKAAAEAAVKANLDAQAQALADLEKKLTEEFDKKIANIDVSGSGSAAAYDDTAIKEALAKLGTDLATVQADLEKALKDAMDTKNKEIEALQKDVADLQKNLASLTTTADMEKAMNELSTKIEAKIPSVDVLNALVNKILTSVTLIPQTYINGIEAIQFLSISYVPMKFDGAIVPNNYADANNKDAETWPTASYFDVPGTTPKFMPQNNQNQIVDHMLDGVKDDKGNYVSAIRVDNGETEAYYRLSPTAVKAEDIDTEKIKFSCTTALTTTRGAVLKDNDPVIPTFKSLENGVLTVTIGKKANTNLTYAGETSTANIVSLMVPRKENADKNVEYGEVYSEFNLIDERVVYPRLAALNRGDAGKTYAFNNPSVAYTHSATRPMTYHFIDSLHIWKSQVDCVDNTAGNVSGYLYVKEIVAYDEPFDLMKLVTGCYEDAAGNHFEITKDQMKKYGLAFRFAIPKKEYAGTPVINQNSTNQQDFAILGNGNGYKNNILYSKLPSEKKISKANKASIGKEPIIRVSLVDTVRGNLVDQAYFKMKFKDNTEKAEAKEYTFKKTQELRCDYNRMELKWKDFIEVLYSQIGDKGMSWEEFQSIYPASKVVRLVGTPETEVAFTTITTGTFADKGVEHGKVGPTGFDDPLWTPGWVGTNGQIQVLYTDDTAGGNPSPEADANTMYWKVGPADIGHIDGSKKVMTTKMIFKSAQPYNYGDITVKLEFTITLPEPKIYGFYQNYWYEKYTIVDVMPVQYLTKAYNEQLLGKDNLNPAAAIPTAGAKTAGNGAYAQANGLYAAQNDFNGNPIGYCVYHNNMLNAFTYKHVGAAATNVLDRVYDEADFASDYDCEKWDFQFRLVQPTSPVDQRVDYKACQVGTPAKQEHTTEPLFNMDDPVLYVDGGNGYSEKATTNPHNAYTLETKVGGVYGDAIWFNWMQTADESADSPAGAMRGGVVPSGLAAWQHDGTVSPYLFADHNNPNNQLLINEIKSADGKPGVAPERTHDKKINVAVAYAYNSWNYKNIFEYQICLVAPLCIVDNFSGAFEEGIVSGSCINCRDAFKMIDFRGYEVKNAAPPATATEYVKYRQQLYWYYEVTPPTYDLTKIRYGMKLDKNHNLVVDNSITEIKTGKEGLSSDDIKKATNGNVVFSIDQFDENGVANPDYLRFKNNGGSNVEDKFFVFIPCSVTYGFGTITKYVKVPVYPHGQKPAGV